MGIVQTQPRRWPSGDFWTVGILSQTPDDLTARLGLVFSVGTDGLGPFLVAVVEDVVAGQLWLLAHDDAPEPGTEVRADLNVNQEDALNGLWRCTGMDKRAFKWLNLYQEHPWALRPFERSLSPRELEVARLIGAGQPQTEVAARLRIAPSTVAGHLQRIYLKLGVHSRAELKEVLKQYPHLARSA